MANIEIYTTQWCPFCIRAKQLFDSNDIAYSETDVNSVAGSRSEMIERSNRHTVPQIFIDGHHVGGCDDLFAAARSGELQAMLGLSQE